MNLRPARKDARADVARHIVVRIGVIALIWWVFGHTLHHEFVNFDDHAYVYQNPEVRAGLTLHGIGWAFTHDHARNWHPLTTLSHMLDCQLFGLEPAGHHFTNVVLHAIATVLLFVFLRRLTNGPGAVDNFWPSAFVAAVFAVHPLRVESVAWVAERKDVLSAVFFMLTLLAYLRHARQPSLGRYTLMSILFVLGLLSKPMLVTVPIILLLLDFWPLGRLRNDARLALLEKLPLLFFSGAVAVITLLVQKRGPLPIDQLPFTWRLTNAVVSYVVYVWQMIWPANLAAFYPHPNNTLSASQIAAALLLLAAISAAVVWLRQSKPYLVTGWFWYVIMLVPVIGIVQVGEQAHADRYTYLPQIGLYVALTWLIADLAKRYHFPRRGLAVAATVIVLVLGWRAAAQARYWQNSETLWNRALAVTRNNDVAHNNLGYLLLRHGKIDEAIAHFEAALRIRSANVQSHYSLGLSLIHNNLANALVRKGQLNDAIPHYEQAVALRPDYADGHYNFGIALSQLGRNEDAIAQWQQTISLRPDDAEAHLTLGDALARGGRRDEALREYDRGIALARMRLAPATVAEMERKIDEYRASGAADVAR